MHGVVAVWRGAPAHEAVALDEVVGDEELVLGGVLGRVAEEAEDGGVVDQHPALPRGALDAQRSAVLHDLGLEVLPPAVGAGSAFSSVANCR